MKDITNVVNYKALKRFSVICAATLVIFGASYPLFGQSKSHQEAIAWEALQEGRAIALMRHALAPGVGDPPEFEIGDCNTQRNLSAEGREQAQSIGEVLRSNGIVDAEVLTSEWCRCQETARILKIGDVLQSLMLNSFFQDRSTAGEQTRQLLESIKQWTAAPKGPRVLVTHQVNISALTGQFSSSGDIVIVTVVDGKAEVLHRIPG